MNNLFNEENIYNNIKDLIINSRKRMIVSINKELLDLHWNIGKIIDSIQEGKQRAKYGTKLLENLSHKLTNEFGKGFTKRNLERMRKFYRCFPIATNILSQLPWSYYTLLISIKNIDERTYYMNEAINSNWNYLELKRMIKTKAYYRLLDNKIDNNSLIVNNQNNIIKDPYILEFIKDNFNKEITLEKDIINHLKEFLLELGNGFSFIGEQVKITIDNNNFYPDLIFYNRILKCFVIIDLKISKLTHKDIGQMQLYVNYYDNNIKREDENNTIGILLCKDKNNIIVKYTSNNNNIYASKYLTYIPNEKEFKEIIKGTV